MQVASSAVRRALLTNSCRMYKGKAGLARLLLAGLLAGCQRDAGRL